MGKKFFISKREKDRQGYCNEKHAVLLYRCRRESPSAEEKEIIDRCKSERSIIMKNIISKIWESLCTLSEEIYEENFR